MTNKDLSHLYPSIERLSDAVKDMNDEVKMWGKIEKFWNPFWKKHLHKWTQSDLVEMAEVIFEVSQCDATMLEQKKGHQDTLQRVVEVLDTYKVEKEKTKKKQLRNVLDITKNKWLYWKFIMSVREIFNNIYGIHLPMANKRYDVPKNIATLTTVYTSPLFTRH